MFISASQNPVSFQFSRAQYYRYTHGDSRGEWLAICAFEKGSRKGTERDFCRSAGCNPEPRERRAHNTHTTTTTIRTRSSTYLLIIILIGKLAWCIFRRGSIVISAESFGALDV